MGLSVAQVGSVLINLGTNVMKLGHNKRAATENRLGKSISVRVFREWQIGVFFFVVGNLANFISFGYAAQSLLAALGSVQFVANVAFASLVLKEKVTLTVIYATGCIVAGCVALVLFGSHSSKQFTVEEIMKLYSAPAYISYLACMAGIVIIMYCVYKRGKKKMLSVGITGLSHYWYRALPISYAMFSGMIGTQSVLFSKTLSTLLRVTMGGNSQLKSWFTWLIIFLFLATSSFWISRLNKALKFFPSMIIVPTMQISWTFFSIASGMLYFQEYHDFELINGAMFTAAVMVIFFGVYLLTKTRVIERRLSVKVTDTFEDEKAKGHEHQVEPKSDEESQNGLNDEEDVRSPIVQFDHYHEDSSQSPRIDDYSPTHSSLDNNASIEVEENTKPEEPHQLNRRASLVDYVPEEFSIDILSSLRETVGLGPERAPGISIFGPPGVGLEIDAVEASNPEADCNSFA